jgi:hypothetical protein
MRSVDVPAIRDAYGKGSGVRGADEMKWVHMKWNQGVQRQNGKVSKLATVFPARIDS